MPTARASLTTIPSRVAFSVILAAAVAPALGDSVVPLDPLEQHVAAQAGSATDGRARAAWVRLGRVLSKPSRGRLSRDLDKILAAAKAAAKGPIASDTLLRRAVEEALDAVDAELGTLPEDLSAEIGRLAKATNRNRVEREGLRAYDEYLVARSLRSRPTERAATRKFRSAARSYEAAIAMARRLQRAQGGPLPQFKAAEAGKIYTVVGTGEGGFNGNGREARRTMLYFVDECAFGPDGRLYILDWNNHRVRCLEEDGTVSAICGSGVPGDSEGTAEETALNHPSSLAFDPQGRIYIAAWHNHKVKVYDPNATPRVRTIVGGPQGNFGENVPATQAKFNLLPGLLRLPNGDLLATDAANQVIRKITLSSPIEDVNVAGVTVQTGVITRFAGTTGQAGTDGDQGQAIDAKLAFSKAQNAEPDGRLARDADGNIYVVSGVAHVIRKIAPDGTITRFAGTGVAGYSGDGDLATSARLNGPSDVAIGIPGSPFEGSVFISDSNNDVIRRVLPNGNIETYAGLGENGYAGDEGDRSGAKFNRPGGIEVDAQGNLYVCDRYNSVIRVIASPEPGNLQVPVEPYRILLPSRGKPPARGASGTIDTFAGSGVLGFNGDGRPALDTELYWPQDVAVDPSNQLVWFCDWNNHRIRRVEADGSITTVVGNGQLGDTTGLARDVRMNHPTDLAFHPLTGELWIAGWHTDKVMRLDAASNTLHRMAGFFRSHSGDGGAPIDADLNLAASVKFDASGNWYVADEGNRRVRFVDASLDRISTLVGDGETAPLGDDGPASAATLNLPVGQSAQPGGRVCLSPDDRYLYIADTLNHRVRRVDLAAVPPSITTVAGDGTAGYSGDGDDAKLAQLDFPVDVDCDAQGNLYIADQENDCIRRVSAADGRITTFAGTGGVGGYTGDGGLATAAKLARPSGLFVVRATGRVYVADTYNGVIRVIWE